MCDLWVFFCLLVRNSCVHICMYRRFTSAGIYALYVYMNPDVEFKKVSKIVFYAILTMLGINFTKKKTRIVYRIGYKNLMLIQNLTHDHSQSRQVY